MARSFKNAKLDVNEIKKTMKDFYRNIHQIYSKTPGEAWVKICRLVMENGMQIHDGDLILKEIINLFVSIEIPSYEDEILIKWGNKDEKEWMRRLWLETKPIPAMGKFPSLQVSYAQRLFDVKGKKIFECDPKTKR